MTRGLLSSTYSFNQTRLEKERREARRLTGQVGLEKVRQDKLEASLRATDSAREQALEQCVANSVRYSETISHKRLARLAEVQAIRAALEQQKVRISKRLLYLY